MTHGRTSIGTALLAVSLGGCAVDAGDGSGGPADGAGLQDRPVAIVRTTTLQWEGEQTYIPLYADGSASGLVVVNLDGGQLFGTAIPDSWTWLDENTVEICASVNMLRNEAGFPPMERDCAPHLITGKELDLDGDGEIDLIETVTIMDSLFYRDRRTD